MRRLISIAFAGWFALSMGMAQAFAFPAEGAARGSYEMAAAGSPSTYGGGSDSDATPTDTSTYQKDDAQSTALSSYLKERRLPLVGAQVLRDPSTGKRVVVLYGFVATDFGKADATTKAQRFFKDTPVVVDNRVMVNPEIASQPKPSRLSQETGGDASATAPGDASASPDIAAGADTGASSMPGVQGYLDQQDQQAQIQQYQAQQSGRSGAGGGMVVSGGMMPLVALLGLLAATSGHSGGFSFGSSNQFGGSQNPFSASPYGYPGSPNSYPPQGGSPYGGGSGFSPYP